MTAKHLIRRALWRFGIDVQRRSVGGSFAVRQQRLLSWLGIDLVLDVGANSGQYARRLRSESNYAGKIVSFEPITEAFNELSRAASGDALWEARNFALGAEESELKLNVAANSVSSSFLEIEDQHVDSAPESHFVSKQPVRVMPLDRILPELASQGQQILLKLDVQGYERAVLDGAKSSLSKIKAIQVELSLVPLYDGGPLFYEMVGFLQDQGYTLIAVEPGFSDERTGQMLQVDGIFVR